MSKGSKKQRDDIGAWLATMPVGFLSAVICGTSGPVGERMDPRSRVPWPGVDVSSVQRPERAGR